MTASRSTSARHPDTWLREALKGSELPPTARLLLTLLNSHARDLDRLESHLVAALAARGLALDTMRAGWPSVETLAEEAGITERNVRSWLRRLEAAGWIVTLKNAGGHLDQRHDRRPNLYALGPALRPVATDTPSSTNDLSLPTPRNDLRPVAERTYDLSLPTAKETKEETLTLSSSKKSLELEAKEREEIRKAIVDACTRPAQSKQLNEATESLCIRGATAAQVLRGGLYLQSKGYKHVWPSLLVDQWEAITATQEPKREARAFRCTACLDLSGFAYNDEGLLEPCSHEAKAGQLEPEPILEGTSAERRPMAPRSKTITPLAASLSRYR